MAIPPTPSETYKFQHPLILCNLLRLTSGLAHFQSLPQLTTPCALFGLLLDLDLCRLDRKVLLPFMLNQIPQIPRRDGQEVKNLTDALVSQPGGGRAAPEVVGGE
ncbi:hypothetical protein PoB_007603500 [Plakobranchus ocellatus]|uniref:Uncharacterized protein n=1 Tax=Plakobranchus ocellatus TaxID=259542 RepID=A0AAV4DZM9_9GAST|nr:hypothetical protein PoB_007603500 [Plakobranchus ocellatus]